MIVKNTNGFLVFRFDSIQEMEMLYNVLPIPNLVPLKDQPMTFIPEAQAKVPYLIKGYPINVQCIPVESNADVIAGFEANEFTYCFKQDAIVPRLRIMDKVELATNQFGKYVGNFMLQPYSFVGYKGRVGNYEAVYLPDRGLFVYSYIEFNLI